MDIYGTPFVPDMRQWTRVVEDLLSNPGEEPIRNVAPASVDDRPFDAIFIGGGAAGRFGGAFVRARGGGAHAIMNLQTKDQLGVEYILNSRAEVIDIHTVEVAGERLSARNLVLATGARTLLPDIPGLAQKGVYDFATLISDLDYEPSRCVIIGGSKVAIEYGSFFQAAGVQTTILTRSPLMTTKSLHHVDDDLREYVTEGMRIRGVEILEGTRWAWRSTSA